MKDYRGYINIIFITLIISCSIFLVPSIRQQISFAQLSNNNNSTSTGIAEQLRIAKMKIEQAYNNSSFSPVTATLHIKIVTDNPKNETSQIKLPVSINKDTLGALHIVGEVENKGIEAAKFMKIIGTVYNAQDQVVGTKSTFTDPETIEIGQTAPFDLMIGFGDAIPRQEVDHVKLHIDWRDSHH
jgi:hypothetical protein